jgi:hypothetical protein
VIGLEDDLGVALGEEVVTQRRQLPAQLAVVVDGAEIGRASCRERVS